MIINSDNGEVLVYRVKKADTFWRRLLGLIPYKSFTEGEGMLISPCQSVHTFFMRFAIDVLYLDLDKRVLAAFPNVGPGRILPFNRRSRYVLELPAGTLLKSHTEIGNYLNVLI